MRYKPHKSFHIDATVEKRKYKAERIVAEIIH